jgi:hypothetical protein
VEAASLRRLQQVARRHLEHVRSLADEPVLRTEDGLSFSGRAGCSLGVRHLWVMEADEERAAAFAAKLLTGAADAAA